MGTKCNSARQISERQCNTLPTGYFLCFFCLLLNFREINFSGIPSKWPTVWIQVRPNFLSGLIWVETVCKCNQQKTPVRKQFTQKEKPIIEFYCLSKPVLVWHTGYKVVPGQAASQRCCLIRTLASLEMCFNP